MFILKSDGDWPLLKVMVTDFYELSDGDSCGNKVIVTDFEQSDGDWFLWTKWWWLISINKKMVTNFNKSLWWLISNYKIMVTNVKYLKRDGD